ncbi:1,4-alpha-glucan branching protein GlgB [Photobacterium profundum]|uniref:1,4-alpha-glucan branching enzyme GlgB n=1 Tax=Photobacterium profundum 3TCK TaxID=314280 RepID=Q1Z6R9_9GAMM|nr:1,4-alpha-glucan branching protein GlgB [Photobacterium profundum]EAS44078.1 glycogen branching enzyme [Photobacterium profundum 3TCK]PSV57304.1 1,4-alpha-glucan branching protein GlgB [Photobacterium profundum]
MQLERAAFSDPFSFLGPQYQSTGIALRVWMPGAVSVVAEIENGEKFLLTREDESGFILTSKMDFTAAVYKLHISWPTGEQTIHDPYQFHGFMPSGDALVSPSKMHSEMGAQLISLNKGGQPISGVRFLTYAPNASAISVIGDFNVWDGRRHPMQRLDDGLWGLFIPDLDDGTQYKFELKDSAGNSLPHKADPWGYSSEQYPSFTSIVYDQSRYQWQDKAWQTRPVSVKHQEALSFYELHAGSWRRNEQGDFLTYRELAEQLIPYLSEMGYTHLELMPVSEHPFYGSWGYQPIGLFSPTSRFGTPDDFKYFVDQCHLAGIGVVLDWVPAHFPSDDHGLANFDGTALFNDPDPRRGWHQDWKSYIYDYGRDHVRRFLVSNALFWFEHYHIDGLRVDAVASMLYLDYSREHDQWIPNHDGGNENYDAISLLRWMNEEVYSHYPNAMTIAEESTAFSGVSRPTDMGGLGFGFKWNMGWMHDSLSYIQEEPVHRKFHHNTITFPLIYAFSENYVLSLSHDEVVYGKGSLLDKMPGDEWQKSANLRTYMGYMYGQPGKKLNFMGAEIAQSAEWSHDGQLEWHWLEYPRHYGMKKLVSDLNHLYQDLPALHELDCSPEGFEWRVQDDAETSVLAHERFALNGDKVLVISNFTPVPREGYTLGVPEKGDYEVLLNTDAEKYWGSGTPIQQTVKTQLLEKHGLAQSITLDLPPLSTVFLAFKKHA